MRKYHKKSATKKRTKTPNCLPYKENEYENYVLWKSLPAILRGSDKEKLQKMGFDDDITLELLSIESQTEFARRYGISQMSTMTAWNNREDLQKRVNASRLYWAKKLTSNVLSALYRNAMTKGYANEVKLWFQIVEDWKENVKVSPNGTIGLRFIDADDFVRRKKKNESTK